MTAAIQPLFVEPWDDAVLRLARKLHALSQHPNPGDRTPRERDEVKIAKRQLELLLAEPPA